MQHLGTYSHENLSSRITILDSKMVYMRLTGSLYVLCMTDPRLMFMTRVREVSRGLNAQRRIDHEEAARSKPVPRVGGTLEPDDVHC